MQEQPPLLFKINMLVYPLLLVLSIWLVFWIEVRLDISFNEWGIFPRRIMGLRGILFSPFIHGDASHLWHNTLPLFILSTALFYFYEYNSVKILLLGFLFTGITTWVIGRASYHIGASGVIYALFGFLLLRGLITMKLRLLAVSFFVVFVYGGMIWYVTPIDYKVSWEGHLCGLLIGFFLAISLTKKTTEEIKKYDWEYGTYDASKDPFMQCFDEQGNFAPSSIEVFNAEEEVLSTNSTLINNEIRLIYHSIPNKRNKLKVFKNHSI